ncbi:MAG TPA: S26 family signal peptidase, partial [Pirellulales bacterium]|nr:S26 family signal peptidase [Pirellulales bacterium]
NADDQLLVWVDGRLLTFDGPTEYDLPWQPYTERDLSPAGIAVRGASLRVRHLRLLRDIYYTPDQNNRSGDTRRDDFPAAGSREPMDFPLAGDQFLVLGDNSPQSKDSRLWERSDVYGNDEYYVTRDLLIGKAMFVYWPHALEGIPGTNLRLPPMLQWIPNFARMRFIR